MMTNSFYNNLKPAFASLKLYCLAGALAMISLATVSCKKSNIPQETGYSVKINPVSITETANGHEYTFGSINFTNTPDVALQIKTRRDTAVCSIWHVYLVNKNGEKYLLPGNGANGLSYYHTHNFYSDIIFNHNIIISHISGPAEDYASVLVTRLNWR